MPCRDRLMGFAEEIKQARTQRGVEQDRHRDYGDGHRTVSANL